MLGDAKMSTPPDVAKIKLKAERGDMNAQNHLGWLFQSGIGVTKNYFEAERWYRMAAEQGSSDAIYNLEKLEIKP